MFITDYHILFYFIFNYYTEPKNKILNKNDL